MDFLVDIDKHKEMEQYDLVLYSLYEEPITELHNIINLTFKSYFIGINELTFTIPAFRMESGKKVRNEIFDIVEDEQYIKLNDEHMYVIQKAVKDTANDEYKHITAYSREFELNQKRLVGYKFPSRMLYDRENKYLTANGMLTGVHDGEPDTSDRGVLNYIFKNVTRGWEIGEVDDRVVSVTNKGDHRELAFSSSTLIQVFQELQKIYNCVFKFDTINRKVNIVSMLEYELEGQNIVNSKDYKGFYISDKNFIKSIQETIEYDKIKTRLYLYGKDGVSIQSVSPVGQPYLDNYSAFKNRKFMTQDLIDAINQYEAVIKDIEEGATPGDFPKLLELLRLRQEELDKLINGDDFILENKGLIALQRELSVLQTEIDVEVAHLGLIKDMINKAEGVELDEFYTKLSATRQKIDELEKKKVVLNSLIKSKEMDIQAKKIDIANIEERIDIIRQKADIGSIFTLPQLKELDKFIREESFNDTSFTENTVVELYEQGKKNLAKISRPSIQFSVNAIDFLQLVEAQHQLETFEIGDIILLAHEESGFEEYVRLVQYTHSPDNNSLSLGFSNTGSLDDATIWLTDLIDQMNQTTTNVDFGKHRWDNIEDMRSTIAKEVDMKLESARQEILNAVGQKYLFGDDGLWLYKETPTGIDPEQIRAINNTIALTDDSWKTVKTAITPQGIVAEEIYGKLGSFAKVRADQIVVGDDGQTIPDGVLSDDILKQSKFYNGVKIDADDGFVATRNDGMVRTVINATQGISIEANRNGKWQQNFFVDANGSIRAREMTIEGLETGSKVFNSTPQPPYTVNDLWKISNVPGVDFKICVNSRGSGSYVSSDWRDANDGKVYADTIKNLTSGTNIQGGVTTINNNMIRITHGSSGEYSQMDASGFFRRFANGRGTYLNSIYVDSFVFRPGHSSRRPDPVRIYLPTEFQGRGREVDIYLSTLGIDVEVGVLKPDGTLSSLTESFYTVLGVYGDNLNTSRPYVDVDSYIVQRYFNTKEEITDYGLLDFIIMVVGR